MSARSRRNGLVPLDGPTYLFPYGRVSKEEQHREGVSIPAQLGAMSRYAERIPDAVAVAEYVDIESGRKAMRHHYQRLLLDVRAAIAERRRVVVVIWRVDRLGRNLGESIRVWDELAALGVEIHSVTEGGVLTPTHYRMFAWMAQEESDRIGARVSFAFDHFERNLWHKPGKPAWGYALRAASDEERRNGAPKQVLAPHAVEAPYVRELWQRFATGESVRALAIWAAGLPDAARGGRNLGFTAISKTLRAPVYIGRLGAADEDLSTMIERPAARWEPLIDDATWEHALSARETARRVPRQASGHYRLTGLLRCDRCGSRMSGRLKGTQGGTRAPRREYICHSGVILGAAAGATPCLATVRAESIEDQVLDQVSRVLAYAGRSDGRADLVTAWDRLVASERVGSAGGRVVHLERQRDALGAEMTSALRKLNRDELTRAEYNELRDALLSDRQRVEHELERLRGLVKPRPAPMSLEPLLASLSGWAAGLRSENVPLVRDALAVLLTRVRPVRVKRGVYAVDLEWTPVGLWLLTVAAERSNDVDLVRVAHLARARWSTLTIDAAAS